ncbi:hypothetical protein FQ707_02800 [Bacteroidaceae bacterium HV4-6-C5C]|jgi:hypothetical protein|nr:hypothetical protein FQ707_02800 [Bacteroidaceae bacterium HV4-6-C5C]
MKWFIINKKTYIGILLCLFNLDSPVTHGQNVIKENTGQVIEANQAQLSLKDTVYIVKQDTVWLEREKANQVYESEVQPNSYDKRIHRYRKRWESLIPTHIKLQYAGNMGFLSMGMGWDYGKHNQWETDVFFGMIPKYQSKRTKLTFTVKQNYMPWSLPLGKDLYVEPLTCGIYFNTVFGNEFWVKEPERYPKGYYGFSSKIRTHIFLGQRLTCNVNPEKRFLAKAVTVFYEISTCDLYMVSAFTNKYLKPTDYLSLSFGLKVQLL